MTDKEVDSTPTQKVHHAIKGIEIDGPKVTIECDCGWRTKTYKSKKAEIDARKEFDTHQEDVNGRS